MQKWCPEPFDLAGEGTPVFRSTGATFAPGAPGTADRGGDPAPDRRFRSERGFTDPGTIMAHLSTDERALVCELVEQDLTRVYEEREAALRRDLEEAHRKELAELRAAQAAFAETWSGEHEARLRDIAAAAARLAVQLTGKLVRRAVSDDGRILVRAIETVLYGAGVRGPLTVTVHPDDAAWLEADPELRERLRIGELVHDRRLERGGCLVAVGGREWDATVTSQLETLDEVVEEWLTTEGRGGPEVKESHDRPVD